MRRARGLTARRWTDTGTTAMGATLFPDFEFPTQGWKPDGSVSLGKDMLYRSMQHVLVRTFPLADQATAYGTHWALVEAGVFTAQIVKTLLVGGTWVYYVFAERSEILAKTGATLPRLSIDATGPRPGEPGNETGK